MIDMRLLARDMGGQYVYWWRRWGPIIKEYRVRNNFPRYGIEAEWLYERMVEFGRRNPDFQIPQ